MENIEQENTQKVQQENSSEQPQIVQLVQSKEAEAEIAELEKRYRETVERENI